MTDATSELLLVIALRGSEGLGVADLDDLLRALARLPVGELSERTTVDSWSATQRTLARGQLRPDHARDLEAFSSRLAEHARRLNTPGRSGRSTAAVERQLRMRRNE